MNRLMGTNFCLSMIAQWDKGWEADRCIPLATAAIVCSLEPPKTSDLEAAQRIDFPAEIEAMTGLSSDEILAYLER